MTLLSYRVVMLHHHLLEHQCPEQSGFTPNRSHQGNNRTEIDHVLVDGCWRMIQNCRIYRSAQFLNTDHRLVVATLKLQLKSGRMVPSQPRLDFGKLKDERVAEDFGSRLSGDLGGLGALGDPEELCSAFKTTVLDVAGGFLGTHRRAKKNFIFLLCLFVCVLVCLFVCTECTDYHSHYLVVARIRTRYLFSTEYLHKVCIIRM